MKTDRKLNNKVGDAEASAVVQELEDRSPLTPTDDIDAEEIRKIEELLKDSELAGGLIRLERKGPGDTQFQYCTRIKVADGLDLDLIKRVWGGGDYKARTFRSNGQTYKQFAFSIDYRIKGSMDTSGTESSKDETGHLVRLAGLMKPDASQNTLFVKMMEQSASSNQQTMQMMMMMMQQAQQQNAAMMTAMATAMAGQKGGSDIGVLVPVLTAMINRPVSSENKGNNIVELVTVLEKLNEIRGGSNPAPKDEEKEESLIDKLIKYGGPVVAALLTRQPIQMPGVAQPPNDPQPLLPPPAEPPAMNGLPPEFGVYVNMVIGAAAKNADVGTYADLIQDNLDPQQANILCGILQQPDWVEKLAQTDARVLNFKPWFSELRRELLEAYGVIEPTNQSDAKSHAAPREDAARPIPGGGAPVIVIPGAGSVAGS